MTTPKRSAAARVQETLVRIRPVKNRAPRRYTVFSIRFDELRGWYRVDAHVAEYLKSVHTDPENPDSPLLFDICTEEQAREVDRRELQAKLADGRAAAAAPNKTFAVQDVTSAADARASATPGPRKRATPAPEVGGDLTVDDLVQGTSREKAGGRSMRAVQD